MTQRPELRRQWKQHCADHGYIPWDMWKVTYDIPHPHELTKLRVSGRGGGKTAQAVAAGFESISTFPEPKLGTVEAAQMITHDPDDEPLLKEGKQ